MTLEGMIRNDAGEAAVRNVEAPDYPAAKAQLVQLVGDGSKLLWMRKV